MHAPSDEENTKCIRMTREFEASTANFNTLTFRFIRPGDYVVPYKPKKGEVVDTLKRGQIAREQRMKAREYTGAGKIFQSSRSSASRWLLQKPS